MWRVRNEEWERKKSYLVQSLFGNVPALSPIAETHESNVSPAESRAYSPLPDLIIEKEPNRHDESDEYYEGLAVRMRKVYNKLFHGVDDESCEDILKSDEYIDTNKDYMKLEESVRDVHSSHSNLKLGDGSDKSNESRMSRVSDAHDSIHEQQNESNIVRLVSTQAKTQIDTEVEDTTLSDDSEDETEIEDTTLSDDSEDETEKGDNTLPDDSDDEIETMRGGTRRTTSIGSILETSTVARQKDTLTPIAQSKQRMSIIQNSESLAETEDFFYSRDGSSSMANRSSKRTRSGSGSSESQTKKIKYESKSVQTDPIKKVLWEDIRGDFFRGNPLIYKLVKQ